jgi:hypothetical protein
MNAQAKPGCRTANWKDYKAALKRRGDFTMWFTEQAIVQWCRPRPGRAAGRRNIPSLARQKAKALISAFALIRMTSLRHAGVSKQLKEAEIRTVFLDVD